MRLEDLTRGEASSEIERHVKGRDVNELKISGPVQEGLPHTLEFVLSIAVDSDQ